jgi:hypothetical protein
MFKRTGMNSVTLDSMTGAEMAVYSALLHPIAPAVKLSKSYESRWQAVERERE